MKKTTALLLLVFVYSLTARAQHKMKQLSNDLVPAPNEYRTASGAPGPKYWQNRANYELVAELDDARHAIKGSGTITYFNNSPDNLTYLWLQLDQNLFEKNSDHYTTESEEVSPKMDFNTLKAKMTAEEFEGGFRNLTVKDKTGKVLKGTINKTMMRVDLPTLLKTGESIVLQLQWEYNINDITILHGRSGYEPFKKDGNFLYTIAQWYPRMCVYSDFHGWQNRQFLGEAEFSLPFGDFNVSLTVPADFVVTATGELQNEAQVLTTIQRQRLQQAGTSETPVPIITQEEAIKNEQSRSTAKKTWLYAAKNVRDFAWAASRKLIWDARTVKTGNGKNVMAMAFYPKEANPLWGQQAVDLVAHTVKTYSQHTFDYPYPVAIAVNALAPVEYPMLCFSVIRPREDGSFSDAAKFRMATILIHEVGHNFFPMIVNSDERSITWMDEGLNNFLQYLAEQAWDPKFPSFRGPAKTITAYMKKTGRTPIMTDGESVLDPANSEYGQPVAALNILRETVMGHDLFDYAFKEYATRWMFKHPTPADFFRTMEDASAVDLDWFWRGWFFSSDHVDISIDQVKVFRIDTKDPDIEKPLQKQEDENRPVDMATLKNKDDISKTRPEDNTAGEKHDPYLVSESERKQYQQYFSSLDDEEKKILKSGMLFYEVHFKNSGGIVMPLIVELEYEDGTKEMQRIPVEIWKQNDNEVSKVFLLQKKIKSIQLDPLLETADVDTTNNTFSLKNVPTGKIELGHEDGRR